MIFTVVGALDLADAGLQSPTWTLQNIAPHSGWASVDAAAATRDQSCHKKLQAIERSTKAGGRPAHDSAS